MGHEAKEQPRETVKVNEAKWSKELMKAGWTAVPSVFLERQQALGLDAIDVNIILQLARHWWHADKLPFPSKKTIAQCMNVHPRTVQRRIARLEHDGLIKRNHRSHPIYGQQSNFYDLTGLITEAKPFAKEALSAREKASEERATRRTRKNVVPVT
jgi:DNA-binding transcriptional regulator YhcF (GntR family)